MSVPTIDGGRTHRSKSRETIGELRSKIGWRRAPDSLGSVSVGTQPMFEFDNSFVRDLSGLYEPWQAAPAPAPRLLVLNEELAAELGADAAR